MSIVIAYIVVLGLSWLWVKVASVPINFLLWKVMRTPLAVSQIVEEIAGVICAVAFGYGVFRLLAGPGTFTTRPFLATALPLVVMLFVRDIRQAVTISGTPSSCFGDISSLEADTLKTVFWCRVLGKIAGLVATAIWFLRYA